MNASLRPQPAEKTTPDPEPQAPPEEPRVIVRRRSPGWPTPRSAELPRGEDASK